MQIFYFTDLDFCAIITLKIENFHSCDVKNTTKVNMGIAIVINLWHNEDKIELKGVPLWNMQFLETD